ncbi:MAG: glycosyltransferase [Blautia sp.]|uniref:glycosyltransferase family 2 protein n=1 Tax=Blautia sp. TaxID=1955243 RepID=UPI002EAB2897|nr:glycosyltransferase [Blautia sp.]
MTDYRFKFSIISAVYNAENYLEDAIQSILVQDIGFQDSVELILVDDGSPDSSGSICDFWQKKYPDNIKVIHKENGGVSSARNAGIAVAEGRYINFMDSDDKLSPDTLSSVYQYFITIDDRADLVSIPIYFFEKKEQPHRLNYKFASNKNLLVDLNQKYSFVQLSAASAFFKREVLTPDFFSTTLRYAEDARAIMGLFLKNPIYGIVPQARYDYRCRESMNSALNGSKLHKEWYLDCLQEYVLWSAQQALALYGSVPKFVQFHMMYDLQSRFRMEEFPEHVLTPSEKEKFMVLLKECLSYISDPIILEQKNLSKEQKDLVIRTKYGADSGILEYKNEDYRYRYGETTTASMSSYVVKLQQLIPQDNGLLLYGSAKTGVHFPKPEHFFVRLTAKKQAITLPCSFQQNADRVFRYHGSTLACFYDFQVLIPYDILKRNSSLEICMTCNSHTVKFRNLTAEPSFPVPPKAQKKTWDCHSLFFSRTREEILVESGHLLKRCITSFKSHFNK